MNNRVINVGVLGHVDSGKTSVCAALSDVLSTAALDKNPQSVQRGITLDLQFSAITLREPDGTDLIFTLVDCPGHASLIRTIIGGSSIIDMVMMVIDATKGIQTQTAEGLVLAEITTNTIVIVLNKIDLLPEASRAASIEKMISKLRKVMESTKFGSSVTIIPFAARPGGGIGVGTNANAIGIDSVKDWLRSSAPRPVRDKIGLPFLFAVDHCFSVKGKGTVATGTVLRGRVDTNSTVEIHHLRTHKKVKAIQMFRRPVEYAQQGDRVGLLLPGLDPATMERGLICAPDSVPFSALVLASFNPVRFFKIPIKTKSKFHITIGHATVLGTITLLSQHANQGEHTIVDEVECLGGHEVRGDTLRVLLALEHPVAVPADSLFVASKLDADVHANACRLGFFGSTIKSYSAEGELSELRVFKTKTKRGEVERIVDGFTLIGKGLFKKETDMNMFNNMRIELHVQSTTGDEPVRVLVGTLDGAFGKSGKFKVKFDQDSLLFIRKDEQLHLTLKLKRYLWQPDPAAKRYVQ